MKVIFNFFYTLLINDVLKRSGNLKKMSLNEVFNILFLFTPFLNKLKNVVYIKITYNSISVILPYKNTHIWILLCCVALHLPSIRHSMMRHDSELSIQFWILLQIYPIIKNNYYSIELFRRIYEIWRIINWNMDSTIKLLIRKLLRIIK